jgi:hypothetical protein
VRALIVFTSIALLAARAAGAGDCLAPLAANPGWACHADLSNGQAVDFCLQHTHTLGDDPASRFFKMKSAGPYSTSCTCKAKGKSPGAAFGTDKSYLCLDRATDTVVSGKISNRKIAGQTFNVSAGLRSTFVCAPDPICTVQPIVDHDLPATQGAVDLPPPPGQSRANVVAAGSIDVGYLGGGCSGYATEAPTFTYDVEPTVPGSILFFFSYAGNNAEGLLVMTPSGEARCATKELGLPLESGTYAVWMRSRIPGDTVEVELVGTYVGQ